jgi:hypothetical protein
MNDDIFIPQSFYWGGIYILGFWFFILWLIGNISGWADLAKLYPMPDTPSEPVVWHGWQHGRFRGWVGYNGCLWVGLSPEGLYLKTGPDIFFRFGHPPLFIPWTAITVVGHRRALWRNMVELKFNTATVSLMLPEKLLQQAKPWLPILASA